MPLRRKPFEPSYVALVLLSNPVAAKRWERLVEATHDQTAQRNARSRIADEG